MKTRLKSTHEKLARMEDISKAQVFCTVVIFLYLVIATSSCGRIHYVPGPQGPAGESVTGSQGERGNDGSPGLNGNNGTDGANGRDGIDATPVTIVQLCPGTTVYPSTFTEIAFCVQGKLYGTYSANGGFSTELVPGAYASNGINSSCSFVVGENCSVSN